MRTRWVIFVPLLAAFAVQPPGLEPRSGTATFTDLTGGGTCTLLGEPPDNLHVGLSSAEFGTADVCGAYLDVTGPNGTVRVQITDHCPRCAEGLVDLSRKAFAMIGDVNQGRVPVTYALARNPPLAEPLALRVKTGSSVDWMQIQALDHGNPLASVELQTPAGWRSLARTRDNFWTAASPGPGAGPFTVRVTDIFGLSATIGGVELAPDVVQRSGERLYPSEPVPAVVGGSETPVPSPPPAIGEAIPVPGSTPGGGTGAETEPETDRETDGTAAQDTASDGARHDRGEPTAGGETVFALFVVLAAFAALWKILGRRRLPRQHHRLPLR